MFPATFLHCVSIGLSVLFGVYQFARVVRWTQRKPTEGE